VRAAPRCCSGAAGFSLVEQMPSRGMGLRYGSMEAEEQALGGQLEQGAANGGAAPPREGEQVVAARTDVSMGWARRFGGGRE